MYIMWLYSLLSNKLLLNLSVLCSGFVRGPPNTVPEFVTFQQDFKKGALLTVVSFVERFYSHLEPSSKLKYV